MKFSTLMAGLLLLPALVFANPTTININTADSETLVDGLAGVRSLPAGQWPV